nr:uncharacterized protein LOC114825834 [Malus domestica]
MSSLVFESGLRYRIGVHKNSGHPQAVNSIDDEAPTSLMPGFCTKAAFSYEKGQYLWRQNETRKDIMIQKEKGGSCTAWFQDGYNPVAVDIRGDEGNSRSNKKRSPFRADFFGSLCYTLQHGKFRELYGDLTRIDARLDICSASALAKRVINGLKSSSANSSKDPMSSPRGQSNLSAAVMKNVLQNLHSHLLIGTCGNVSTLSDFDNLQSFFC